MIEDIEAQEFDVDYRHSHVSPDLIVSNIWTIRKGDKYMTMVLPTTDLHYAKDPSIYYQRIDTKLQKWNA